VLLIYANCSSNSTFNTDLNSVGMMTRTNSTAQSFTCCCTILLLVMQHISDVQGFATRSTSAISFYSSSSSSPSSRSYYGYSHLKPQRCIFFPFIRGQRRNNNHITGKLAYHMVETRSTIISRIVAHVSHIIPFQRHIIADRRVLNSQPTKNCFSPVKFRKFFLAFGSMVVGLVARPTLVLAMGAMGGGASKGPVAPVSRKNALSLFGVFFGLFLALALLHAAEIAITTLYPWKVREFAEEVSMKQLQPQPFVPFPRFFLKRNFVVLLRSFFIPEGGEKRQGGDIQNLE
jgi:hypothetical protein